MVVAEIFTALLFPTLAGAVILLLIHLAGYIRLMMEMRKTSVPVSCPRVYGGTIQQHTSPRDDAFKTARYFIQMDCGDCEVFALV